MLEAITAFFTAVEQSTIGAVNGFMAAYGGLGIAIGMFLESSIIPIPSELILIGAGALGFDPLTVAFWGAIGSTLGSIVGYYIGCWGGRPIVDRVGPYLFITPARIASAERKFSKYGGLTILGARLIPFIPFKVFSIASGILKFDLKQFVLFTFIGTIPRAFILAWIGVAAMKYAGSVYALFGLFIGVAMVAYALKRLRWFEKAAAMIARK